jgi:hypothetical protein
MPVNRHELFPNKRIAIFDPRPKFMINPTLVSLLKAFTDNGACLDVMMPVMDSYPAVEPLATRHPFPESFPAWKGSLRNTWKTLLEQIRFHKVRRHFKEGRYDLLLGVDSAGLIAGFRYARRFGLPLVYLSFEIFFLEELSKHHEIREKKKERVASHFADLIVIQDDHRARLLAEENGLPLEKFTYLPVSTSDSQQQGKNQYLRKRFKIPEDSMVVLHAGTFSDWTYGDELMDSLWEWPDGFTLVVHTRYNPKKTGHYLDKAKKIKGNRIHFSFDLLPQEDYEKMITSADIGLVLYKVVPRSPYTMKNIQHIGLSSGKFSYYMKYGIPVITVQQKTYEDLLSEYAFGEHIPSMRQLPTALNRIRTNYQHHRRETRRLFEEKLDFEIHWPKLARRFLKLMDNSGPRGQRVSREPLPHRSSRRSRAKTTARPPLR